jgi:hypothetical protein
MLKLCKILTLLSVPLTEGNLASMWDTVAGQVIPESSVIELTPPSVRTRRVLTRLSRGLVWEPWGVLPTGDTEVRVNICKRDELSQIEIATKLAQFTEPDDPEILGGAGTMDDQYVYQFQGVRSRQVYKSSPFQILERLQNFLLESSESPTTDPGGPGNEAGTLSASAEAGGTERNRESTEGEAEGEDSSGKVRDNLDLASSSWLCLSQ